MDKNELILTSIKAHIMYRSSVLEDLLKQLRDAYESELTARLNELKYLSQMIESNSPSTETSYEETSYESSYDQS